MGKLSKEMLSQITAKRERMSAPDSAVSWRLSSLLQTFHYPLKHREEVLRYFPIAVVATLEGYFRSRLALLIDSGQPFITNAMESYPDIKLDMALAGAIAARSVGLGEIIMHSISMSSFESLVAVLRDISGRPKFLEEVVLATPESIVEDPRPKKPIISDMEEIKRRLSQVFATRHILCHEFGDRVQLEDAEIRLTLLATQDFIKASSVWLDKLQNPYRLTPEQKLMRATAEQTTAKAKLADLIRDLGEVSMRPDMPREISEEIAQIGSHISAYLDANKRLQRATLDHRSRHADPRFVIDETRLIHAFIQSLQDMRWQIESAAIWAQIRRRERKLDESKKHAVAKRMLRSRRPRPT